ncbi:Major facilitator superfamily domain, general substrate transporter [Penicillium griseofulvum]|uniref:Major facilitator superfamily domain, general substrate transporter n=1 Tax=Penicillium patulum TaxID=5078 RepID=A0A135LQF1_PENPA|nr:Major facilitator superfamily domain, general substrate transporter [Penicillium griseofulvum]KXG51181.1 Major facilitator superfamily domain, general substrate transporter [Penicillium griseofulvum]
MCNMHFKCPSPEIQHVDYSDSPRKSQAINFQLIFACTVFAAASFLFGFDDKIISPVAALPDFVEKFQGPNPVTGKYVLTARNQNLVFSLPLVGSVIGGLLGSPMNFHFGRKWPLIIAYLVSVGGGLLQVFAPNLGAFVGGRSINAVALGIVGVTAPLYVSEVVPAPIRGRCVSSMNIMNLTAGVVGTVVVFRTEKIDGNLSYQIPIAVQCVLPIILLVLTVPLPESPQWLAGKGNIDEARRSLRKLRGSSDTEVEDELRLMKLSEENERELHAQNKFWHIFQRQHLKRTLAAGSFFSLNQISGIILSTTYTTVFLTELGIADAFSLTIIASCCTLAGTIAAPFVIDRAGRRPTAFFGMGIMFIIDAVAGGLAFDRGNKKATMAIAALSFIFNFFWASSFSSLSNLMPSEMATPKLRHHTMSYTIACAQTTAVITTLVVPRLTSADAAGLGAKTYLIFAGCMAAIIVFFYFFMPETRGRTFAEIDEMYAAKIPMWRWRSYETSFEVRYHTSKGT